LLDTDLWIDHQGLERRHLHRQRQEQLSEETSGGIYVVVNARSQINGVEKIENVEVEEANKNGRALRSCGRSMGKKPLSSVNE
jgi:Ni,Fe-hydrogenase III large subunit